MSRRESWDWATEQTYIPRGVCPRVHLVTHTHRCPDGTHVVVAAQYIAMTGVTLYRWKINGVRVKPTSAMGDCREVPPDWSLVDLAHRAVA